MKRNMAIINIAGMVVLLIIAFYISNTYEYKLEVDVNKDGVKIKTLALGGYYSSVNTLEIYEKLSKRKVVEFLTKSEKSRMHTVTVRSGKNEFNDMYLDGYDNNYPSDNEYIFKSGVPYRVVVKWQTSSKETEFVIQNNK